MFSKQILSQFVVYNLGGFTSYMLSIICTWFLVSLVGQYSGWLYVLSLVICFFYLGLYHFFVTFRRTAKGENIKNEKSTMHIDLQKSMMKFAFVFIVFAYFNVLLADFFIIGRGMYYIVGITLAGFLISIVTFFINKLLVFKSGK